MNYTSCVRECFGDNLVEVFATLTKLFQDYASLLSSRPGFFGSSNLARSSSTPIVIRRHNESAESVMEGSASRPSKLAQIRKELAEARLA